MINRINSTISICLASFFILSCCILSEAANKNNIIGTWIDNGYKVAPIYIFVEDNGDIILYSVVNGKTANRIDILKNKNGKYFSQSHNDVGEYYVIGKNNVLEIYDNQGFIRRCKPYTGPSFPLSPSQVMTTGTQKIDFIPTVKGDFQVLVDINTDLHDGAVLSVSLSKHGLASNDLFIGTDFEKVPVAGGKASILIDARRKPHPSLAAIVKGEYDVEVCFHPRWPENRKIATNAGITMTIEAIKTVSLNGTAEKVR